MRIVLTRTSQDSVYLYNIFRFLNLYRFVFLFFLYSEPVHVMLANGRSLKVSNDLEFNHLSEILGNDIQYKIGKNGLVSELEKIVE